MPRTTKTPAGRATRTAAKTTPVEEKTETTTKRQMTMPVVDMASKASAALASLATVFFIVWILIGLFVLLVIIQGIRHGQYAGLLGSSASQNTQTQPQDNNAQSQTEVNLPGIGTVNVSCVQQALSADSLQKVIQAKSIDVLSGDEKTRFQACITKPETSGSPAPSASAGQ